VNPFVLYCGVLWIISLFSVRTEDKIPCDRVVVYGTSVVDESSLVGESRPVRKSTHDNVPDGKRNEY